MMLKTQVSVFLALFVISSCASALYLQRVGGLGEERTPDDEVKMVISKARNDIDKEYPRAIKTIEPLSYKVQTVAGKNYFIKALFHETNGNKTVNHLRIYKSFRGPVELSSIKTDVKRHDSIEYFE